jgi:peptidoglycan hydrolase-like protein with peptidoglycan-binding domain
MMSQRQQELKDKGFYKGSVDGISGPKTRMAIRRFQKSIHVTQSGRLDQATMDSLGLSAGRSGEASRSDQSSKENSYGNTSSDTVRQAQQKLADGGYYSGKVDGMMNEGTRSAIRQYQHDKKLEVNGHLNRETAKSMGISTSRGNFEDNTGQSPLEQLGKGVAEGANIPQNKNTKPNTQQPHE